MKLVDDGFFGRRPVPHSDEFVDCSKRVLFESLDHFLFAVPRSEVNRYEEIYKQMNSNPSILESAAVHDKPMMTAAVVLNRLCNRVCSACANRNDIYSLKRCGKCLMTWYCNDECFALDQSRHSAWCCKLTAAPDGGPAQLKFSVRQGKV